MEDILNLEVLNAIKTLGGILPSNFSPKPDSLPPSLQLFSTIQWPEGQTYKAHRHHVNGISFEKVEHAILDKSIWNDNSWVQNNNNLFILGHSNYLLVTLQSDLMTDFLVYIVETKGLKMSLPISKFLKSCHAEQTTTYQLEHGDEIFTWNWDEYFLKNDPIPAVAGKKSQEAVWYSGKAAKLMQFYQENYRAQTVSWIGKKQEKQFKNISYSTLIRFMTNVIEDLKSQERKRNLKE